MSFALSNSSSVVIVEGTMELPCLRMLSAVRWFNTWVVKICD